MSQALFDTAKPWAKVIFTAFLMAVGFLSFFLLGQLVNGLVFGFSGLSIQPDAVSDPENTGRLKILQAFQSVGLFVAPSILAAALFSGSVKSYLHLKKESEPVYISLLIIFLIIAVQPLINWLAEINHGISLPDSLAQLEQHLKAAEEKARKLTEAFLLHDKSISAFLINLVIVALIPAIGEELLFRGVLQNIFKDWSGNVHAAVWTAAVLFSAFHFQFYGFLPRLLLGALFGYLLVISGNMYLPVLAHFLNNALGVSYYHFFYEKESMESFEKIGNDNNSAVWLWASLMLSALLIFLLIRNYKPSENHPSGKLRS